MNKKAISPLIATVLLIGFAVALAAVVMTWGSQFIKSTTESTSTTAEQTLLCANLNLDVSVNTDCTEITLINNNDIKIKEVIVRSYKDEALVGDPETLVEIGEDPLIDKYGTATKSITLEPEVNKIEVIPVLEGGITCADAPVEKSINCP